MKNYYKYSGVRFDKFENEYFELDFDMICLRAIYLVDNDICNTSINVKKPNYFLPEGQFDNTKDLIQIDEKEFQNVWNQSTLPYANDWSLIKSKLKVGDAIEGSIVCFYPQGAILNLDLQFFGIADHDRCKNLLGIDKMYPGNKLVLTVQGFDDVNMWILLE